MDADAIISYCAEAGVHVTERRVISARRGGQLAYSRAGRSLVSHQDDVDAWIAAGCPAPRYERETTHATPDDLTDRDCVDARLRSLPPARAVSWVLRLTRQLREARAATVAARSDHREALLAAARHEGAAAELEARVARLERLCRRLGGEG